MKLLEIILGYKLLLIICIFSTALSQERISPDLKTRMIIEQAVKKRHELQQELETYIYKTYTKSVSRNKSYRNTLTMIFEYHSVHYFVNNGFLKEVCGFREAGETGLIWNPDLLRISLADTIEIGESRVITPLGQNTFDFYNYMLKGIVTFSGIAVYEIEVKPKNNDMPLFEGFIWISNDDYSVTGLEFTFNKATKLPKIIRNILFTQQFALFYEKYWLPIEQHSTGNFYIEYRDEYGGLENREFGVSENTIIVYDHKIKKDASFSTYLDDFEDLKKYSKNRDSEYWELRIGLLSKEEKRAFKELPAIFSNYYDLYSVLK